AHQLERKLADVLRDGCEAGVQGRVAQEGSVLFLDVHLPRARKALQNPTPAATVVRDRRKLLLFYPPNLQTKNLHLFARGRTARTLARRAIGFVSVGRIFRR